MIFWWFLGRFRCLFGDFLVVCFGFEGTFNQGFFVWFFYGFCELQVIFHDFSIFGLSFVGLLGI